MSAAEQNRAAFPHCAAFVDQLRATFGPEVKPVFLQEAGQQLGKPPVRDGVPPPDPTYRWARFKKYSEITYLAEFGERPVPGSFEWAEYLSDVGARHYDKFI